MKHLFTLLILLTACGKAPQVDPDLQLMLDHYLALAPHSGKLGAIESIEYATISDKGERGICNIKQKRLGKAVLDDIRDIRIDPIGDGWNLVQLTVYHEFGHCIHDLPHSTGIYDIMNPRRTGNTEYWTPERVDAAIVAMFQ